MSQVFSNVFNTEPGSKGHPVPGTQAKYTVYLTSLAWEHREKVQMHTTTPSTWFKIGKLVQPACAWLVVNAYDGDWDQFYKLDGKKNRSTSNPQGWVQLRKAPCDSSRPRGTSSLLQQKGPMHWKEDRKLRIWEDKVCAGITACITCFN